MFPVPCPSRSGRESLLWGRLAPSLPLLGKAPWPAPSFKKSRKVCECTGAQVSCAENSGEAETSGGKTGQLSTEHQV